MTDFNDPKFREQWSRRMAERPEDPFEFHMDLTDAAMRVKSVAGMLDKRTVPLTEEERAELTKWLPKMRAMAVEMAEQVRQLGEFSAGLAELRGDPKPDDVCECGHYYAEHAQGMSSATRGGDPRQVYCEELVWLRWHPASVAYTCGCHWFRQHGKPLSEADQRTRESILEWAILTGWKDKFGRDVYEPVPGRLSSSLVLAYLIAHPGESYLL